MSDPDPSGDNPFGNIPFLGDLARMLQGQGSIQWEAARQLAYSNATEGQTEPNVDPAVRFRLGELARVAELHVQQVTGLDTAVGGRSLEVVPVNRTAFTSHTLDAYRPLFETLAGSLGQSPTIESLSVDDEGDAGLAMLGQLLGLVAPTMLGMAIGSMVGRLARRSFGQYDLPLPRPVSGEIQVLPATISAFAEDWSLPEDELLALGLPPPDHHPRHPRGPPCPIRAGAPAARPRRRLPARSGCGERTARPPRRGRFGRHERAPAALR